MIEELRAAAEALEDGDPAPFAPLFAEDAELRDYRSRREVERLARRRMRHPA